jgi:DivIVA domain-containing protein
MLPAMTAPLPEHRPNTPTSSPISSHTRTVASGDPSEPSQVDGSPPASPGEGEGGTERENAAADIRDVSFPLSVRGYDRNAVDAYVDRVQDVVAHLEATHSPEAAVRQALANVGEHTKGVLSQAGETAEQIILAARREAEESTARAREEAEQVVAEAKAEASALVSDAKAEAEATVAQAQKEAVENRQRTQEEIASRRDEAEARMRELGADTEAIRQERTRLVDDVRELAARVDEVASAADTRFPRSKSGERVQEGEPEEAEVEAKDQATR